jgi:predicted small lipoprotein YifL
MKQLIRMTIIAAMIAEFSACGDKKDSAERAQEAQRAMQEGVQKEKAMMEGMQKGVENMEKKMTAQKEETKK